MKAKAANARKLEDYQSEKALGSSNCFLMTTNPVMAMTVINFLHTWSAVQYRDCKFAEFLYDGGERLVQAMFVLLMGCPRA